MKQSEALEYILKKSTYDRQLRKDKLADAVKRAKELGRWGGSTSEATKRRIQEALAQEAQTRRNIEAMEDKGESDE